MALRIHDGVRNTGFIGYAVLASVLDPVQCFMLLSTNIIFNIVIFFCWSNAYIGARWNRMTSGAVGESSLGQ